MIEGADEVLVTVVVSPRYGNDETRLEETKAKLAALPFDYDALLARHTAIDSVSSPRSQPAQTDRTERDDSVRLTLPPGQPVTLRLELR